MNSFLDMEGNLNISHVTEKGFAMPRHHFHSCYEIYYNPSGGVTFLVQDRLYEVSQNDMLIFNDRDFHHPNVPPDLVYERYIVTFRPDFIRDFSSKEADLLSCFERRPKEFCHKIHLADDQARAFQVLLAKKPAPGAFFELSQKLMLAEILITVNTLYYNWLYEPSKTLPKTDKASDKVFPLVRYINENLAEELSLDELASRAYLNKYYFSKLFKEATGFAPHEYISLRRILRASELLRDGIPVSRVCELVGYRSNAHFITKFKSYWGIPPKQFMLLKQKEERADGRLT